MPRAVPLLVGLVLLPSSFGARPSQAGSQMLMSSDTPLSLMTEDACPDGVSPGEEACCSVGQKILEDMGITLEGPGQGCITPQSWSHLPTGCMVRWEKDQKLVYYNTDPAPNPVMGIGPMFQRVCGSLESNTDAQGSKTDAPFDLITDDECPDGVSPGEEECCSAGQKILEGMGMPLEGCITSQSWAHIPAGCTVRWETKVVYYNKDPAPNPETGIGQLYRPVCGSLASKNYNGLGAARPES